MRKIMWPQRHNGRHSLRPKEEGFWMTAGADCCAAEIQNDAILAASVTGGQPY